jgi:hypothetical protein
MSDTQQFEVDWQHIILAALAIAGGFLCAFKPETARIIGPLVSAIVPLALAKKSPVTSSQSPTVTSSSSEEAGPTVINIGTIPSNMTVSDEGDLKITWDRTKDKT